MYFPFTSKAEWNGTERHTISILKQLFCQLPNAPGDILKWYVLVSCSTFNNSFDLCGTYNM